MRIGVISDTHIPVNGVDLPPQLLKALKGCDMIIHAGDLVELPVLRKLEGISKVVAVYGNMDPDEVKSELQDKRIIEVEGKKICIMHGYGHPKNLVEILKNTFFSSRPDIIIFGHSHNPMNEYMEGVLFFNPGSVTDTAFAPYRSYGIIEIEGDKISASIHRLD